MFDYLKGARNSLAARIAELPGVATVQSGIRVKATLDLPEFDEPASGMIRSLPDFSTPELNRLFLRSGHWLGGGNGREVLVGEAFAQANQLLPGQTLTMLLNGKRQEFRVA